MKAAREYAEAYQGKSYIVRTYQMAYDYQFPDIMYPPNPPLVSVSSITYIDSAAAVQTVTSTVYTVDAYSWPPRIFEAYGQSWSTGARDEEYTIKVAYVAGYAAKVTAVGDTDVITVYGRTFADADIVRVYNSGGALPTGLSAYTDYHVRDYDAGTFKLAAAAGGAAIDLTGDGTGTNYIMEAGRTLPDKIKQAILLITGHLYEHREETIETALHSIPLGAKTLLMQDRVQWL
jgi:hypothetical protein